MPGITWFIALAVVSAGLAVYILAKKRDTARLVAFYLFATMVAYIGEILVMMLFGSYSYKPGVFLDRFEDDIIGHLIPNSTVWPATALLVAVYAMRARWFVVIAAVYMLLDVLFIRLGVYVHNWWSTWMTGVAIFTYCVIMKGWYRMMEERRFRALRYVMFSMILCFILFEPSALLLLLGKQACNAGWFDNLYRDAVTFEFTYHFALALVCAGFICLPDRRAWKLAPFAIVIAGDLILLVTGALSFFNGWNFFFLMLVRVASLGLFILLESRYRYKRISAVPSG